MYRFDILLKITKVLIIYSDKKVMIRIFYIVVLTFIDLASKELAEKARLKTLVYNKNIALGIEANDFVKFYMPLIILPLFIYFGYKIDNKKSRDLFYIFLWSGFLGNYISRFNSLGVVDFIPFFGGIIINIADIYTFVLQVIICFYMFNRQKQKNILGS